MTFIASRVLTSHHEIGASEMGKARGADTAPIWPIGPVTVEVKEEAFDSSQMAALRDSRNQINGHFSFGCFDGCVRLSWGHGKSLGKDL
jgi:hypothetical protein